MVPLKFRYYFFIRSLSFVCFLDISAVLVASIFEMEYDQYTLSPEPLADIGDEVTQFVQDNLWTAVAQINDEIAAHQACLNGARDAKCHSAASERKKIAELQTNDAIAHAAYKLLGDGTIFVTYTGTWLNSPE